LSRRVWVRVRVRIVVITMTYFSKSGLFSTLFLFYVVIFLKYIKLILYQNCSFDVTISVY
jgi:hypothetical protein